MGEKSAPVAGAMEAPWSSFANLHARLGAPLRPSPSDVANIRSAIEDRKTEVVLLGVTPELASLGDRLTAFDYSPNAIASIWPGDSSRRRAVLADWRNLPVEDATADAVIGDGSLNAVAEGLADLLAEISRVLSPSGRVAIRAFCSPEAPESLEALRCSALDGRAANFHAFKWRVAMALAADFPDWTVPVVAIREAVDAMFSDRDALSRQTGWGRDDIDAIDCYAAATQRIAFPPLSRLMDLAAQTFARRAALTNGSYPLCDRCPTVVFSHR